MGGEPSVVIAGFAPHFTPVQMLEAGVFGGAYFERATWEDLMDTGEVANFARSNRGPVDYKRNRYGVKAGQTFAQWTAKGWIFPEDPLGWFHWYCRWHAGRRHERDAHQQRRWVRYLDRWGGVATGRVSGIGNPGPVVSQGLLQWGIDVQRLLGTGTADTWDDYLRVTAGATDHGR